MRKAFTIIAITVLALATIQCKKKVETIKPAATGGVRITLNVDNDQKVVITPGESITTVTYESGDVMLVANGGHYVGYLTHDGEKFSGDITADLSREDKLHFFFLGNKVNTSSLTAGSSTSCVADMSNQSSGPAVISYAATDDNYDGSESLSLNVRLLNKASGLMKFTTDKGTTNDVSISRMKTQISVNFETAEFTPTNATGSIHLCRFTGDTDNKTFLAVIPVQSSVNSTLTVEGYEPMVVTIPEITLNLNGSMEVPLTVASSPYIDANFTVEAGKTVKFSRGNLQYIGSAGDGTDANTGAYWQFARNQYDYLGTTTGQNSESITVDRDLFGWATSGWDNGNYFYQPYCTSKSTASPYTSTNGYGYGPKKDGEDNWNVDIINKYNKGDWGVYNRYDNQNNLLNGGNKNWRTLKGAEWKYLLGPTSESPVPGDNCRTSSSVNGIENARFTFATISTGGGSVKGMIIFPDSHAIGTPSGVTWGTINAYSNYATTCDAGGWAELEAAGCVFLPAAGRRLGYNSTSVSFANNNEAQGFYWSSTRGEAASAHRMLFASDKFDQTKVVRYYGCSVRLVFDNTAK